MPTKGAAVSVIVPVYNAEKTLVSCIGSVLHQPFEDIEVLAVDDGSTDQSLALLREIAARDGRVRVFAQDNSGVAAARNLALNHAVGTYVQFVDSDDLLAPDATGAWWRHGAAQVRPGHRPVYGGARPAAPEARISGIRT